jgi:4-amino-4-deoxychorismate lyase
MHLTCTAGFLRYWLSAGRGNFDLTPLNCDRSEFYCIFFTGPYQDRDPRKGINVVTSSIPNKPGAYAEIKSVDYLQNVHNAMEAHDQDAEYGIFVHEDGSVAEGPTNNISIITKDGILRTPPFRECLAGCTIQRIISLVEENLDAGEKIPGISKVEQVRHTMGESGEVVAADKRFSVHISAFHFQHS